MPRARSVPLSALASDGGEEAAVDRGRFHGPDHPTRPRWWAVPPRPWADESPEDRLFASETRERIVEAVESLPRRQRTVVVLRDLEGWSAEEVCDALELTGANQRLLLHRGRSKVRRALERHLEEGRP